MGNLKKKKGSKFKSLSAAFGAKVSVMPVDMETLLPYFESWRDILFKFAG